MSLWFARPARPRRQFHEVELIKLSKHHETSEDYGDSHLKALLIHHVVIVPITTGKLDLGTVAADFLCGV
jgi:thiamine phosphate synthase YjbQ (UPF0047 family)